MNTRKELRFAAKRDVNGNRFGAIVDVDNKQFQKGYNLFYFSEDDIEMTKKELYKLLDQLKENGYEEV